MRPAFSSTQSAAAFAVLLLVVLLLPALAPKSALPPREQSYACVPWNVGAFPYLHDQIFAEKGDIDIVFMSASPLWWAMDTPYVQEKLGEKLGRPAVVRSLCWSWQGYDSFYFIAQDLLQRRKVRLLVCCDLSSGTANTAHLEALHWFRFADNAGELAGLAFRSRASFYASAMVGMPANLLGLLRRNLPAIPSAEVTFPGFGTAVNPALRLGSLDWRVSSDPARVVETPPVGDRSPEVRVYSPATRADFRFTGPPLMPMQLAFARKLGELTRSHEVKLAYLHVPKVAEANSAQIETSAFWPDVFHRDVTMMGMPGAKLFAGLASDQVLDLYFDYQHFNRYGQKYYTRVVTPELMRIYEEQTTP